MRTFTEEEKLFIAKNTVGVGNKELSKRFNARFGTNFIPQKFKDYKLSVGLKSGLTGRFEKGHVPYSKGKKMKDLISPEEYEKFKKRGFQKGNRPKKTLPVGTEVKQRGEKVYIKVAEPNKWKLKQTLIWEKHHKKALPDNKIITFLDGNRSNFDIKNLEAISRKENMKLNFMKARHDSSVMTKTEVLLLRLNEKIEEKRCQ